MTTIKIVLMSDHDVGKTSIINRFVDNNFTEEKPMNQEKGINKRKTILIRKQQITLELIDLDMNIDATATDFFEAKACIGIFDYNNPQSIQNIRNFLGIATRFVTDDNFVKCLCGNKIDLECKLTDIEINDLAEQCNVTKLFKISALTGDGVNNLFFDIADSVLSLCPPANFEQPKSKCVFL